VTQLDDLDAWLRLLRTTGIGRASARRLLAACGSPQAVFNTPAAALRELVGAEAASALNEPPAQHDEQLAATRAWLEGDPARHVLVLGDAG
jgi:DNA processing protein